MSQRDYLLDTHIIGSLIELKSGIRSPEVSALESRLHALPKGSKLVVCPISIGESESGFLIDSINPDKRRLTREYYSAIKCLPIDANVARESYAILRSRLFAKYAPKGSDNRKKKRIEEWKSPSVAGSLQADENDLWIAAVAMAYNLVLVTRDNMTAIRSIAGNDVIFENWIDNS